MRAIKILIACGGGIATSSYAAAEIEKCCKDAGVDYEITKGKIMDVPAIAANFDVCMVTSKYAGNISVPLYSITGLITGIGAEELKKDIVQILKDLNQKINS